MQITKDILQKYANTTVEKLTRIDHTIIAVYMTGSMVTEESPLLGGAADIDLVFIHVGDPQLPREILRLTDDIHLDIAHHPQRDYIQRRELRVHPWMGPILAEAISLYDPQHFMDLTQASVRGLFYRPDNVILRARGMFDQAREYWLKFQQASPDAGPTELLLYLNSLACAANAIALLGGDPLTERRFLLNFPRKAERINRPGLYPGLLGMLGAQNVSPANLTNWIRAWENTFTGLPTEGRHPRLHPYRQNYYLKAFEVLVQSENPNSVLWPLLTSWTLAAQALSEGDPDFQSWRDACLQLGLLDTSFADRGLALDAFLDQIEEATLEWAQAEGA
jgi:hypothetical protein